MSDRSPIYLVGPMGVGKSTIGGLLAKKLKRPFIDTDRDVERMARCTIAEIFERDGEAHFRRMEADAIAATAETEAVVALGGGAIAQPGAAERLLGWGQVVYLAASAETLLARVGDPASRPLLAELSHVERLKEVARLHEARRPYYESASIQIEAEGRAERVVERLVALLNESPIEAESRKK